MDVVTNAETLNGLNNSSVKNEEQGLLRSNEEADDDVSFSPLQSIPPIPIAGVKEKNFLVGKVEKSAFCSSDFHRCFPDGLLHLFVGTWNMEKCKVPENINDFLLPAEEEYLQEIYVVGVQEASPDQFPRQQSKHQDGFETQNERSGCYVLPLLRFILLIPGERKTKVRIDNYHHINEKLNLPDPCRDHTVACTDRFDNVFWFGDLNFRISQPHQHMKNEVSDPLTYNIDEAMKCDQLKRHMLKDKVFVGFEEATINFLPTYKFDPGTNEYDTSHKLRVPSYTDRILYKCKIAGSIRACRYDSVMTLRDSDHRPVYAVYEVRIKEGVNRLNSKIGHFNREVYLAAAKRRGHAMKKQKSYTCVLL